VTYVLTEEGGRLKTTAYAPYSGYTLVIAYAADGKLARRGLVRRVRGGT
jgi:hypothetical protein